MFDANNDGKLELTELARYAFCLFIKNTILIDVNMLNLFCFVLCLQRLLPVQENFLIKFQV